MMRSIDAAGRRLERSFRRVALGLALCVAPLAFWLDLVAAGQSVDSAEISLIAMEKDCFGCSGGERLVLRRDGLAVFTQTGHARHGRADQTSVGQISAADFEALARLILAQGFMTMQDSYADPQLRDGAWTLITVERSGVAPKQVFRREAEGPAGLDLIAAAIDELRARTSLTRKHP